MLVFPVAFTFVNCILAIWPNTVGYSITGISFLDALVLSISQLSVVVVNLKSLESNAWSCINFLKNHLCQIVITYLYPIPGSART